MADPADPKARKLSEEPLFGAPAPDTDPSPSPSGPAVAAPTSGIPVIAPASGTSNPLFGASQSAEVAAESGAKKRVELGSRERVETLRRARAAELGSTSNPSTTVRPPPPINRLSHAPTPSPSPRPSTLISYIRRLSFVLSILLGAGATLSLIWSALLLPRLHASFSARRALVDQQVERAEGLLQRLRAIRGMGIHAGYKREEALAKTVQAGGEAPREKIRAEKGKSSADADDSKAIIREIPSSAVSTSSTSEPPAESQGIHPLLPDLIPLLASLKDLSSTRGNTSTTRTSLLSTIESYTSALHRQLWNPRPGAGFKSSLAGGAGGWGTGYGLNTLDQSLRDASGRGGDGGKVGVYSDGWEGEGLVDRSEEWDQVRKEVRGIKGMLLGRRSW